MTTERGTLNKLESFKLYGWLSDLTNWHGAKNYVEVAKLATDSKILGDKVLTKWPVRSAMNDLGLAFPDTSKPKFLRMLTQEEFEGLLWTPGDEGEFAIAAIQKFCDVHGLQLEPAQDDTGGGE